MTETPSAQDLKSLLQTWWAEPPAPGTRSSSGPTEPPHRRLQQVEVLIAVLPMSQVTPVVLEVLVQPADGDQPESLVQQRREGLVAAWTRAEKQRWTQRRAAENSLDDVDTAWIDQLTQVYGEFPESSLVRPYLLAVLAWQGTDGLSRMAELLVRQPPQHPDSVSVIFQPLVHRDDLPAHILYPQLLQALGELALATAIIDLSNFLYRERDVRPHPVADQAASLGELLAQVTQRLLQIEENPVASGLDAERLSQVVNDSVGLVAALCDALALCGDASLVGKIYPCLEVKHRRVQLESATALAALGQDEGRKRLVDLAAQPVVRRRVLEYARELGFLDEIDDKFKTPAAQAESELALWLSHPANMGFAPLDVTLVDQRQQYWPGFDQPVDCFLLRYSYPFQERVYTNLGLVGPITHSFSVRLSELPPDDAYAVFAGWHVEHPEIYAVDYDDAGPLQRGTIARLENRLQQESLNLQQAYLLGHCLGQWSLIARAERQERVGWVAVDQDSCIWLPDDAGFQDFDASLVWYLHLGRKLLEQFNG